MGSGCYGRAKTTRDSGEVAMIIGEFVVEVITVAAESPICEVPFIRNLTPTSVSLRVPLTIGGFVDSFYNEHSGTTAYALIQNNQRIFGADNTGGWHLHPFNDPKRHDQLPAAMSFAEFIAYIEQHYHPASP